MAQCLRKVIDYLIKVSKIAIYVYTYISCVIYVCYYIIIVNIFFHALIKKLKNALNKVLTRTNYR